LTGIGYFLGQHEAVLQNEEVRRYVTRALLVIAPIVVLGIAWYVVRFRRRRALSQGA
jgi:membrane protein DedA with SNARE-associated domain